MAQGLKPFPKAIACGRTPSGGIWKLDYSGRESPHAERNTTFENIRAIRIDSGKRQSRFSGVREGKSSAFLATAS